MSFLDEPIVRNIVAQSKTTIDFREIMDSGKILLVKLSPQFKEVSLLIGEAGRKDQVGRRRYTFSALRRK